jgi:hypothetical protein
MIRIHLAQIFYNPCYYHPPIDYLEEPAFLSETDTPIGKLRAVEQIESFLLDSKSSYIQYIHKKLIDISLWSANRGAHILAFPEYSVPLHALPDLQNIARKHSMIIIAGTHRVTSGDEAKSIYQSLGMVDIQPFLGHAVSPILLPDGSVQTAIKLKKSKWEPELIVPSSGNPRIVSTHCRGEIPIRLSVLPCIDSLSAEVFTKLWSGKLPPQLIICPSLSPASDPFKVTGAFATLQETLFSYVNTASFGGTSFSIPSHWEPFLAGPAHYNNQVPEGFEAILELNVAVHATYS